jgi:hypothetical protein
MFRFAIVIIIGKGRQEMIGHFQNLDDGAYPLQVLSSARGNRDLEERVQLECQVQVESAERYALAHIG